MGAGVHPAVAAMRRQAAQSSRTVEDAIVGRQVVHVLGQNKAPGLNMDRLGSDPTYNPQNFFKGSSRLGVNPLRELMLAGKDGPSLPEKDETTKTSKSKKDSKKKKK